MYLHCNVEDQTIKLRLPHAHALHRAPYPFSPAAIIPSTRPASGSFVRALLFYAENATTAR